VTFQYDGNKIINFSGFELNNDENKNKTTGSAAFDNFKKNFSNNPTKKERIVFLLIYF
jgi:hypothetical protein